MRHYVVSDVKALSSIIENVRRASQGSSQAPIITPADFSSTTTTTPTPPSYPYLGDPVKTTGVDGQIHAVSSKIILIRFSNGFNSHLAKLIPGQMYVDGKQCLGYIIRNNQFHTWPLEVRQLLQQGSWVKMDVRKLSKDEVKEVEEITSEVVTYSSPLIWRASTVKPSELDLTVSRVHGLSWVLKGILVSLHPKWGVLRTKSGDVFFEAHHLYVDNSINRSGSSLLNYLEVGDVLAVQCRASDYLQVAEVARAAPGFTGRTDGLAFYAQLVWNIPSEIDPYSVALDENQTNCRFLTTSSTLNSPLPLEREARYTNLYGVVEELHLPAGGIVTLDPGTTIEGQVLSDEQRHVYFHRSRIYLNGSKIQTSSSLDTSLVPGDRVAVDVFPNHDPASNSLCVTSQAFWIALSLRAHTTDRGISIANNLRMEVVNDGDVGANVKRLLLDILGSNKCDIINKHVTMLVNYSTWFLINNQLLFIPGC